MENYQVFISYRREGGEDLAGRISDKLKSAGYEVFYDIESMHSGKFNAQIYDAIDSCSDVLLILPKDGLERCKDENDWVRIEVAYALKKKKNIIPVMMRGFAFPETLPEDMDGIQYQEGVSANSEYFDAMIGKIEKLLTCTACDNTPSEDENLQNGVRFLGYGMYSQAIASLEKAMQTDLSNPEVYFYMAIATLGGTRPFLIPKSTVDKALEYLSVAITIESKALYHYLAAYIKYDFHQRKMLRVSPDYTKELQTALGMGITNTEIQSLFELLKTQMPDCF